MFDNFFTFFLRKFVNRESIQFSTFGESEILKATEVQVYHGVYYDSAKKPWENGLLDPHMVSYLMFIVSFNSGELFLRTMN